MTASSVPTSKVSASSRKKYASEPPKTEQIDAPAIGKVEIKVETIEPNSDEIFLTTAGLLALTQFSELLKALRCMRDSRAFLNHGCHTFREWCMKQFGERIGALIEENL